MNRLRGGLVGSSALSTASNLVSVAVAILLSPFIVHEVGLAAFGLWSVVLAVLQYVQIADGSLPTVTIRHVAKAASHGETEALRGAIATTVLALSIVAAVIAVGSCAAPTLLASAGVRHLPAGWQWATRLAGLALGVTVVASGLGTVTRGLERWDVDAGINVAAQLVQAALTVVLLLGGLKMVGLGFASLGSAVVTFFGYAVFARRRGALGTAGFRPRRSLFRELRRQGVALQVVGLVTATNSQADRLMLLPFASLSFVGAYSLGSRVAGALRGLAIGGFGPLLARFATAESSDGRAAVAHLYGTSMLVVARFVSPALLAAYFAGYPAVLVWLGSRYQIAALGALLLGIGYAVNVMTGPGTSAAVACGRAQLDRDYSLLGLAVNLCLSLLLGVIFGAWGVIAATTLGLGLSSLWLVWRIDRFLAVDVGRRLMRDRAFLETMMGVLAVGGATLVASELYAPASRVLDGAFAAASVAASALWISRTAISSRMSRQRHANMRV